MRAVRPKLNAGRPTLQETKVLSEKILTVAQRHFLKYGYVDTTLERIAADAGTSKGAIYTRFEDKAKLFSCVCSRFVEKHYQSDIVRLNDNLSMRDSLREQASALVSAAMQPQAIALLRMITRTTPQHPEIANSTIAVWDFYVAQITAYFQSRIDRNLLQLRNPRATATIFARMIFGSINAAWVHGLNVPTQAELARHIDDVVLVFLGGIGRLELEAETPQL